MRPNLDRHTAQIIPFPARNRFQPQSTDTQATYLQGEDPSPVCSEAFDSWYHAAAIAEERGRPNS